MGMNRFTGQVYWTGVLDRCTGLYPDRTPGVTEGSCLPPEPCPRQLCSRAELLTSADRTSHTFSEERTLHESQGSFQPQRSRIPRTPLAPYIVRSIKYLSGREKRNGVPRPSHPGWHSAVTEWVRMACSVCGLMPDFIVNVISVHDGRSITCDAS